MGERTEQTVEEVKDIILNSFRIMDAVYTNAATRKEDEEDESYKNYGIYTSRCQAIIAGAKLSMLYEVIEELGWNEDLAMSEEAREDLKRWGYALQGEEK